MIQPEHTSFNDFRDNLAGHMRDLKRSKKPTFILRNGRRAAVLLSPEAYERLTADSDRQESIAAIRRGLSDAQQGNKKQAGEVLDRLEAKYRTMTERSWIS